MGAERKSYQHHFIFPTTHSLTNYSGFCCPLQGLLDDPGSFYAR
jgi:hypothetical protein